MQDLFSSLGHVRPLLSHLNNIQSPIRQQLTQLNHLLNPQRHMPS
ncbi:hypothetical protein FBY09_12384 [Pseudomonas sp. SJZ101]|nr:hypothetical protein FBY02_12320 [Pseudomonas sp. SJZ078]TWC85136.1 hypothetical protein FBY09_12384 [Pseudomonas sp. SJZ101]